MLTDPIADMLTRIRNAQQARKPIVRLAGSREKLAVLEVMKKNGFVKEVSENKNGVFSEIEITLDAEKSVTLRRVSKPGRRIYAKADELKPVLAGLGIAVISTSQGVMTNKDAKQKGIGGEIICEIY